MNDVSIEVASNILLVMRKNILIDEVKILNKK